MMTIKLGLMGFGNIGRKLYSESLKNNNIEISAISDIGDPEILEYLLKAEFENTKNVSLDNNYLINNNYRSRILSAFTPGEMTWDLFDVDFVVDATGKFNSPEYLDSHLNAGAKRVIISTLPSESIDRLVVFGINQDSINLEDRTISAGSSTLNALAYLLNSLLPFGIDAVNMTTIHSFTSDQSLQDTVGTDFRCSRSASENIIPNNSEAEKWIVKLFPELNDKINCNALNVPVQKGSMLDLSIAFVDDKVGIEDVNSAIIEASELYPDIIGITNDPIVSSDIIGDPRSLVFDVKATMKGGNSFVKVLAWYDNGHCHAMRILDVIKAYSKLEGFNQ
jgi:glyceraldehyde 3-phosphate dehydrogenase|tara:strand:- start:660 stop:1667 length:1008 start_codon:yes stop_codon:yes gene_type:complete